MSESYKRHESGKHAGAARTSPYPVSRLAPVHDLVHVAKEIQKADNAIRNTTHSKLRIIAENIRHLQAQALEVLEQARKDADLHRALCSFSKRPGHTYHLYQRADGQTLLSMISPHEWGEPPHEFLGTFRLEADLSWTPVEETEARDAEDELLKQLFTPALPASSSE